MLFLSAGDLPDTRMELLSPASPALVDGFFTTDPPGKPSQKQQEPLEFQADKWQSYIGILVRSY